MIPSKISQKSGVIYCSGMLICVYGEDGYRVTQKVKQLRDSFKEKFDSLGMNLSEFNAKAAPGEVLSAMRSGGLLSPKRMVIIDGLLSSVKKGAVDTWVDALCETDSDAIVILSETIATKDILKQPLAKAIKDAQDRHDYTFDVLSERDLERWIVHELNTLNATIDTRALRKLMLFVGGDTWQLSREIQKLVAYAAGELITEKMVTDLVHGNFEGQIFAFIDAVSQKNTREAVRLLEHERVSGSADGYLQQMLLWQVRLLLGARSLLQTNPAVQKTEVASELGVHPFVAQKALAQARRYELKDLVSAHGLLFQFDQKTKQGMDPGLAVERVMVEMLQK